MVRVTGLYSYPVKGCAGVPLDAGTLSPAGPEHDRTFMVVDPAGEFRSQRTDPRLALVRAGVEVAGAGAADRLTLSCAGVETLPVTVDTDGPRHPVRMHTRSFHGVDQGDTAAEWLSTVLGRPSRLVRVPPEHHRETTGLTPGTAAYADSSAVLLMTRRSLDELTTRLRARGADPVPMDRFRPNVVLDGWETPHAEDEVRRVAVGEAELGFTKVAVRCAVTTVDQERGVRAGPEPLRTLAEYRRTPDGVALGTRFAVTRPGKVSVGDEVRVSAWAGP
ncbi:MOSC domain-containing protein [Saccharomonospora iraqiensis]|uniref:MOSC domain-containing protein n=1 Tax=Saccharomonospora iraqiensis TaxID=52698 RepID=UPI00040ADB79|nr:MOSC N-terminal beta barrel domain-containing protein [Saccharomonospora iraqiensis]